MVMFHLWKLVDEQAIRRQSGWKPYGTNVQ